MEFRFERDPGPAPWGPHQPKFEHIVTDGPGRYFLVGRLTSGEPVRIQLAAASVRKPPPS
jgi:hypothetical protein